MELSDVIADQRALVDRRAFSWRTVFFGFMRSRRHGSRRDDDGDVIFLDWHHPWLFCTGTGRFDIRRQQGVYDGHEHPDPRIPGQVPIHEPVPDGVVSYPVLQSVQLPRLLRDRASAGSPLIVGIVPNPGGLG
jgi:hypothetical protein